MTLHFPNKPDVRLQNPPLHEVICQVRFPPILKILHDPPMEFQDQIRSRFPELEIDQGIAFRVPGPFSSEKPAAETQPKIYRFQTADGKTTVSLAPDFFAVSTSQYSHWEAFADDLRVASEAAIQVYRPAYATRIGLRYINRFTMENTGLENIGQVIDLFNPDLTALLRSEAWSTPLELLTQLVLDAEPAKLTLRTGFASRDEVFYLLDLDYFEEGKLELDDLLTRTGHYHEVIYDAFRWCIKEEALELFDPVG